MDDFGRQWWPQQPQPPQPTTTITWLPEVTKKDLDDLRNEFLQALEKLREDLKVAEQQDIEEGNPDCGIEEKRELIRQIAESFGVEIDFL
jgi:hypothetical protein